MAYAVDEMASEEKTGERDRSWEALVLLARLVGSGRPTRSRFERSSTCVSELAAVPGLRRSGVDRGWRLRS